MAQAKFGAMQMKKPNQAQDVSTSFPSSRGPPAESHQRFERGARLPQFDRAHTIACSCLQKKKFDSADYFSASYNAQQNGNEEQKQ